MIRLLVKQITGELSLLRSEKLKFQLTILQMKRFLFSIVLLCSCILIAGSNKKNDPPKKKIEPVAHWTGTIQLEETVIFNNLNLKGKGERRMSATFINALPTLYRDDESTDLNFTDDKGTGKDVLIAKAADRLSYIR
jgi:hypothetical protein